MTKPVFAQIINPVLPSFIGTGGAAIGQLIGAIVGVLIIISGIAFLFYLLWGGFEWLVAGGEKTSVEKARSRISNGLIGLVIVVSGWALMVLISSFFCLPFPNIVFPTVSNVQRLGGRCGDGGGGGGGGGGGSGPGSDSTKDYDCMHVLKPDCLSGITRGDAIPQSVWDNCWRPFCIAYNNCPPNIGDDEPPCESGKTLTQYYDMGLSYCGSHKAAGCP